LIHADWSPCRFNVWPCGIDAVSGGAATPVCAGACIAKRSCCEHPAADHTVPIARIARVEIVRIEVLLQDKASPLPESDFFVPEPQKGMTSNSNMM
jgi:hypothetical protein